MSLWQTATRVAQKALGSVHTALEPKLPHQDTGLPYGGRIGALAEIGESAILVATTLGSIIESPETGEVVVKAISRVRMEGWPSHLALYRYYLTTGDSGEKERYIQVLVEDGEPKEAVYFSSIHRLFPDTPETIQFYTGEDSGDRVGGREWVFGIGDLKGILSQDQLQVLGDKNELVYSRAIGEGDYYPPLKGIENRIDDGVGNKGIHQKVWCMPYVRQLDGNIQEHLFVSFEVMDSHDGKKERDVHVDFMVGISISTNDFRII